MGPLFFDRKCALDVEGIWAMGRRAGLSSHASAHRGATREDNVRPTRSYVVPVSARHSASALGIPVVCSGNQTDHPLAPSPVDALQHRRISSMFAPNNWRIPRKAAVEPGRDVHGQEEVGSIQKAPGRTPAPTEAQRFPHRTGRPFRGRGHGAGHRRSGCQLLY